jgi:hypothetical protein
LSEVGFNEKGALMKKHIIGNKRIIVLFIVLTLLFSYSIPISAATNIPDRKSIDLRSFSVGDKVTISNDLEILKSFGIKPDSVKYNSNYTTGEFTYTTNISGSINDISLLKRKDGSIIFDVKEGDIENHLVVEPNGDMYLDGRKLEISDVSSENFNGITPKRASSWSSRPPAGVKSWSYHRTVSRKKVYLNTKAGQVTAAVIGIILTGAGWVGYVYNAACFAHLTGGYSSCLSFKSVRYVGNPRYLRAYRLDQTLYTEANFKGKSTFYRTYGYNIPNV